MVRLHKLCRYLRQGNVLWNCITELGDFQEWISPQVSPPRNTNPSITTSVSRQLSNRMTTKRKLDTTVEDEVIVRYLDCSFRFTQANSGVSHKIGWVGLPIVYMFGRREWSGPELSYSSVQREDGDGTPLSEGGWMKNWWIANPGGSWTLEFTRHMKDSPLYLFMTNLTWGAWMCYWFHSGYYLSGANKQDIRGWRYGQQFSRRPCGFVTLCYDQNKFPWEGFHDACYEGYI